jgi:L-lactate dehydrogenase complex protein LldG
VAVAPVSARDAILGRVRAALADVPAAERPEDVAVARAYRTAGQPAAMAAEADAVERFAGRVADYRAGVRRVGGAGLAGAIEAACRGAGVQRLAVPADLDAAWLPPGVETLVDDGTLGPAELDRVDGVLTACALAVAETGTIALDGGPAQGRRALTLVPDVHLCVVRADQVVEGVPELVAALAAAAAAGRPITLVSGPSATSDIELQRVEGVHGPRRLEVLIVEGDGR